MRPRPMNPHDASLLEEDENARIEEGEARRETGRRIADIDLISRIV